MTNGVRMPWEEDWGPAGEPDDSQLMPWEMDWAAVKPARKVADPAERAVQQIRSFRAGMMDPVVGLIQLGSNIDPLREIKEKLYGGREALGVPLSPSGFDEYVRRREQEIRSAGPEAGIDIPRALGTILSPAGLIPAGRIAPAAGLLPRVGQMAGVGALSGLSMPATEDREFLPQKMEQAGMGATFGAGATLGLAPLARMVAPRIPEGVQELRAMGVVPTIGQRLGETASRIEQGLTSAPLLGSGIREARNTAIEEFNIGIGNRALARVGEKMPKDIKPGHEAVSHVGKTLNEKYSELLPKLTGDMDSQFMSEIQQLQSMATNLPETQQKQFEKLLKIQLFDKFTPTGKASGETLKEIERQLGHFAAGYRKSPDFDTQQLGMALREVQASLRGMIERNNPAHVGELQAINGAWSDFLRMENAASKVGTREGIFTPAQLKAAARLYDPTRKKSAFARGEAPIQKIAETGQRILGTTVPDSGTPFRTALGLGMLGGGYLAHPYILAGELATMAPYVRPGQVLMDKILSEGMGWRQPLGGGMRRLGAPAGALGAGPLSGLFEEEEE